MSAKVYSTGTWYQPEWMVLKVVISGPYQYASHSALEAQVAHCMNLY